MGAAIEKQGARSDESLMPDTTAVSLRSEDFEATSCVESNKHGLRLLKELFADLDPSVQLTSSIERGEVQVSLKYDFKKAILLAKLIRCRDVAISANEDGSASASSFELFLLYAGNERSTVQSTEQTADGKRGEIVYNEIFSFPLAETHLDNSTLVMRAVAKHENGSRSCIGEFLIRLKAHNFNELSVHTAWYTLQPETDLSITGDLGVDVLFVPPRTLQVTAHGISGMATTSAGSNSSLIDKGLCLCISLSGSKDMHTSKASTTSHNPMWEETFVLTILREELHFRYLEFDVRDSSIKSAASVGQAMLLLDNLADVPFSGKLQLGDLSVRAKLRNSTQRVAVKQEFREALWAHSMFQFPTFVFTEPRNGDRVVRVTCDKAGAKAKLRLQDGVPVVYV